MLTELAKVVTLHALVAMEQLVWIVLLVLRVHGSQLVPRLVIVLQIVVVIALLVVVLMQLTVLLVSQEMLCLPMVRVLAQRIVLVNHVEIMDVVVLVVLVTAQYQPVLLLELVKLRDT
jgi:hypothetical protein